VRGTTVDEYERQNGMVISIPVPRARDDGYNGSFAVIMDISIPVPRARDDRKMFAVGQRKAISIPVPRARDDRHSGGGARITFYFNPRPSCEGRHKEDIK